MTERRVRKLICENTKNTAGGWLGVRKKVLRWYLITASARQDWYNKKVRSIGIIALLRTFIYVRFAKRKFSIDVSIPSP